MSTGDAEDGALGPGLKTALPMSIGVLAVACGSPPPPAFHPGGGSSTAPGSTPAPTTSASGGTGSAALAFPPFGKDAHVVMTSWRPAPASEIPAVTAAKNFLLAVLYADYTGGQDHRWTGYVFYSTHDLLSTGFGVQGMIRRFLIVGAIAAAGLLAPLAAPHASAGTGVGCQGNGCSVSLNQFITYKGDYRPGGTSHIQVTEEQPPCLWVPIGDAITGSNYIVGQFPNPSPGLPYDIFNSVQQAKQLLANPKPARGTTSRSTRRQTRPACRPA